MPPMQRDPWTDRGATSLHRDGHRVGLFLVDGRPEWWAYPAGWVPRGEVLARGPFRSRKAAKASLDPTNVQNWTTPQIDFELGAADPREVS